MGGIYDKLGFTNDGQSTPRYYQMCRKTPAFRHGDIRYNKGKHIEKLVCRHN